MPPTALTGTTTRPEIFAPSWGVSRTGYNIAKPDAHLYMFCDFSYFRVLYALFSDAGWNVFRTPFIWFKPQTFRAPWPEHGPQRKYEMILYARKGDKRPPRLPGTC